MTYMSMSAAVKLSDPFPAHSRNSMQFSTSFKQSAWPEAIICEPYDQLKPVPHILPMTSISSNPIAIALRQISMKVCKVALEPLALKQDISVIQRAESQQHPEQPPVLEPPAETLPVQYSAGSVQWEQPLAPLDVTAAVCSTVVQSNESSLELTDALNPDSEVQAYIKLLETILPCQVQLEKLSTAKLRYMATHKDPKSTRASATNVHLVRKTRCRKQQARALFRKDPSLLQTRITKRIQHAKLVLQSKKIKHERQNLALNISRLLKPRLPSKYTLVTDKYSELRVTIPRLPQDVVEEYMRKVKPTLSSKNDPEQPQSPPPKYRHTAIPKTFRNPARQLKIFGNARPCKPINRLQFSMRRVRTASGLASGLAHMGTLSKELRTDAVTCNASEITRSTGEVIHNATLPIHECDNVLAKDIVIISMQNPNESKTSLHLCDSVTVKHDRAIPSTTDEHATLHCVGYQVIDLSEAGQADNLQHQSSTKSENSTNLVVVKAAPVCNESPTPNVLYTDPPHCAKLLSLENVQEDEANDGSEMSTQCNPWNISDTAVAFTKPKKEIYAGQCDVAGSNSLHCMARINHDENSPSFQDGASSIVSYHDAISPLVADVRVMLESDLAGQCAFNGNLFNNGLSNPCAEATLASTAHLQGSVTPCRAVGPAACHSLSEVECSSLSLSRALSSESLLQDLMFIIDKNSEFDDRSVMSISETSLHTPKLVQSCSDCDVVPAVTNCSGPSADTLLSYPPAPQLAGFQSSSETLLCAPPAPRLAGFQSSSETLICAPPAPQLDGFQSSSDALLSCPPVPLLAGFQSSPQTLLSCPPAPQLAGFQSSSETLLCAPPVPPLDGCSSSSEALMWAPATPLLEGSTSSSEALMQTPLIPQLDGSPSSSDENPSVESLCCSSSDEESFEHTEQAKNSHEDSQCENRVTDTSQATTAPENSSEMGCIIRKSVIIRNKRRLTDHEARNCPLISGDTLAENAGLTSCLSALPGGQEFGEATQRDDILHRHSSLPQWDYDSVFDCDTDDEWQNAIRLSPCASTYKQTNHLSPPHSSAQNSEGTYSECLLAVYGSSCEDESVRAIASTELVQYPPKTLPPVTHLPPRLYPREKISLSIEPRPLNSTDLLCEESTRGLMTQKNFMYNCGDCDKNSSLEQGAPLSNDQQLYPVSEVSKDLDCPSIVTCESSHGKEKDMSPGCVSQSPVIGDPSVPPHVILCPDVQPTLEATHAAQSFSTSLSPASSVTALVRPMSSVTCDKYGFCKERHSRSNMAKLIDNELQRRTLLRQAQVAAAVTEPADSVLKKNLGANLGEGHQMNIGNSCPTGVEDSHPASVIHDPRANHLAGNCQPNSRENVSGSVEEMSEQHLFRIEQQVSNASKMNGFKNDDQMSSSAHIQESKRRKVRKYCDDKSAINSSQMELHQDVNGSPAEKVLRVATFKQNTEKVKDCNMTSSLELRTTSSNDQQLHPISEAKNDYRKSLSAKIRERKRRKVRKLCNDKSAINSSQMELPKDVNGPPAEKVLPVATINQNTEKVKAVDGLDEEYINLSAQVVLPETSSEDDMSELDSGVKEVAGRRASHRRKKPPMDENKRQRRRAQLMRNRKVTLAHMGTPRSLVLCELLQEEAQKQKAQRILPVNLPMYTPDHAPPRAMPFPSDLALSYDEIHALVNRIFPDKCAEASQLISDMCDLKMQKSLPDSVLLYQLVIFISTITSDPWCLYQIMQVISEYGSELTLRCPRPDCQVKEFDSCDQVGTHLLSHITPLYSKYMSKAFRCTSCWKGFSTPLHHHYHWHTAHNGAYRLPVLMGFPSDLLAGVWSNPEYTLLCVEWNQALLSGIRGSVTDYSLLLTAQTGYPTDGKVVDPPHPTHEQDAGGSVDMVNPSTSYPTDGKVVDPPHPTHEQDAGGSVDIVNPSTSCPTDGKVVDSPHPTHQQDAGGSVDMVNPSTSYPTDGKVVEPSHPTHEQDAGGSVDMVNPSTSCPTDGEVVDSLHPTHQQDAGGSEDTVNLPDAGESCASLLSEDLTQFIALSPNSQSIVTHVDICPLDRPDDIPVNPSTEIADPHSSFGPLVYHTAAAGLLDSSDSFLVMENGRRNTAENQHVFHPEMFSKEMQYFAVQTGNEQLPCMVTQDDNLSGSALECVLEQCPDVLLAKLAVDADCVDSNRVQNAPVPAFICWFCGLPICGVVPFYRHLLQESLAAGGLYGGLQFLHVEETILCEMCSENVNILRFMDHMSTHHATIEPETSTNECYSSPSLSCPLDHCQQVMASWSMLGSHVINHVPAQLRQYVVHKCTVCGGSFQTYYHAREHWKENERCAQGSSPSMMQPFMAHVTPGTCWSEAHVCDHVTFKKHKNVIFCSTYRSTHHLLCWVCLRVFSHEAASLDACDLIRSANTLRRAVAAHLLAAHRISLSTGTKSNLAADHYAELYAEEVLDTSTECRKLTELCLHNDVKIVCEKILSSGANERRAVIQASEKGGHLHIPKRKVGRPRKMLPTSQTQKSIHCRICMVAVESFDAAWLHSTLHRKGRCFICSFAYVNLEQHIACHHFGWDSKRFESWLAEAHERPLSLLPVTCVLCGSLLKTIPKALEHSLFHDSTVCFLCGCKDVDDVVQHVALQHLAFHEQSFHRWLYVRRKQARPSQTLLNILQNLSNKPNFDQRSSPPKQKMLETSATFAATVRGRRKITKEKTTARSVSSRRALVVRALREKKPRAGTDEKKDTLPTVNTPSVLTSGTDVCKQVFSEAAVATTPDLLSMAAIVKTVPRETNTEGTCEKACLPMTKKPSAKKQLLLQDLPEDQQKVVELYRLVKCRTRTPKKPVGTSVKNLSADKSSESKCTETLANGRSLPPAASQSAGQTLDKPSSGQASDWIAAEYQKLSEPYLQVSLSCRICPRVVCGIQEIVAHTYAHPKCCYICLQYFQLNRRLQAHFAIAHLAISSVQMSKWLVSCRHYYLHGEALDPVLKTFQHIVRRHSLKPIGPAARKRVSPISAVKEIEQSIPPRGMPEISGVTRSITQSHINLQVNRTAELSAATELSADEGLYMPTTVVDFFDDEVQRPSHRSDTRCTQIDGLKRSTVIAFSNNRAATYSHLGLSENVGMTQEASNVVINSSSIAQSKTSTPVTTSYGDLTSSCTAAVASVLPINPCYSPRVIKHGSGLVRPPWCTQAMDLPSDTPKDIPALVHTQKPPALIFQQRSEDSSIRRVVLSPAGATSCIQPSEQQMMSKSCNALAKVSTQPAALDQSSSAPKRVMRRSKNELDHPDPATCPPSTLKRASQACTGLRNISYDLWKQLVTAKGIVAAAEDLGITNTTTTSLTPYEFLERVQQYLGKSGDCILQKQPRREDQMFKEQVQRSKASAVESTAIAINTEPLGANQNQEQTTYGVCLNESGADGLQSPSRESIDDQCYRTTRSSGGQFAKTYSRGVTYRAALQRYCEHATSNTCSVGAQLFPEADPKLQPPSNAQPSQEQEKNEKSCSIKSPEPYQTTKKVIPRQRKPQWGSKYITRQSKASSLRASSLWCMQMELPDLKRRKRGAPTNSLSKSSTKFETAQRSERTYHLDKELHRVSETFYPGSNVKQTRSRKSAKLSGNSLQLDGLASTASFKTTAESQQDCCKPASRLCQEVAVVSGSHPAIDQTSHSVFGQSVVRAGRGCSASQALKRQSVELLNELFPKEPVCSHKFKKSVGKTSANSAIETSLTVAQTEPVADTSSVIHTPLSSSLQTKPVITASHSVPTLPVKRASPANGRVTTPDNQATVNHGISQCMNELCNTFNPEAKRIPVSPIKTSEEENDISRLYVPVEELLLVPSLILETHCENSKRLGENTDNRVPSSDDEHDATINSMITYDGKLIQLRRRRHGKLKLVK